MANSNFVKKPLLEKIQNLLARKPEHYDVAFCLGKEKKIVRALKVILKASSPFLEKKFEEEWDNAVIKEGGGIPLPDFDPIVFELFVKLTSLDAWEVETLEALNLTQSQILNLLTICRRFVMENAVENLEILASIFMQTFSEYKNTRDFLQLSQTNLKSVLSSDDISMKELDVFRAAMSWADFQCKQMKVEPTEENIREVLGDCLFEIRFPTMTCADFTEAKGLKDILTAEENLQIYEFIVLAGSKVKLKRLTFDTTKLPFKTTQRKQIQKLESKPNLETNKSELLLPLDCSNISYIVPSCMVKNLKVVCDGSKQIHIFTGNDTNRISGLGFLAPIERDGLYDVKVQVQGINLEWDSGTLRKRIFVEKGKTLYFVFDAQIDISAGSMHLSPKSYYCLCCSTFTKVP